MDSKEFVHKRICVYAGKNIDPNSDEEVENILRSKLNIYLPQRSSMDDALASAASDHEVIGLILKYRAMT